MATNKERLDKLEADVQGVHEGLQRLEIASTEKMQGLDETMKEIREMVASLTRNSGKTPTNGDSSHSSKSNKDDEESHSYSGSMSTNARTDFHCFSGDDPT